MTETSNTQDDPGEMLWPEWLDFANRALEDGDWLVNGYHAERLLRCVRLMESGLGFIAAQGGVALAVCSSEGCAKPVSLACASVYALCHEHKSGPAHGA